MFFFEQRAVQDHGVAPMFRTCPGTKEATSTARHRQHTRPSRAPPTTGVYVACVPVRRACSCRCRLLQRGQHDAACLLVSCLLVLVLHACSCLCRIWPRGTWPAHPQPMGLMALTHRGKTATFGFLSSLSSLAGLSGPWGLMVFWGFLFFVPCPLKLGLWTGLFPCSFAWSLILAVCMSCS